jgi:hypothetical protein
MVTLYTAEQLAGSPTDLAKPLPEPATNPQADEVFAFCRSHGLEVYFRKAMDLAREAFAPVERLEAEVHQDPATDDKWIVLRVVVRAKHVNVPAARRKFTTEWVESAPVPQRYLIRLSPDIL